MLRLVRFHWENSGEIFVWGPGNFLIAGMNALDRSGRVLLGLAHPLLYRPHAVGRGRAGTDWADPEPDGEGIGREEKNHLYLMNETIRIKNLIIFTLR
jgi:hypothetical protein